jgi:hypothetical protein
MYRLTHNRSTDGNDKIIDAIKNEPAMGEMSVIIPSRDNLKERQATLEITWPI